MKAAPLHEHIWVTNSDVGVSMQGLLDHSVERILLDDQVVEKIKKLQEIHSGRCRLQLYFKFGNLFQQAYSILLKSKFMYRRHVITLLF